LITNYEVYTYSLFSR